MLDAFGSVDSANSIALESVIVNTKSEPKSKSKASNQNTACEWGHVSSLMGTTPGLDQVAVALEARTENSLGICP